MVTVFVPYKPEHFKMKGAIDTCTHAVFIFRIKLSDSEHPVHWSSSGERHVATYH